MLFLVNAGGKPMAKRKRHRRGSGSPKRRRSRRGRFVKGSRAAKAYMASIRPKRGGGPVARRRRKSRKRSSRRRSVAAVRSNPPRRARRSYRRNPPSVRGLLGAVTQGAKAGAFVTLGEAVSVALPGIIRLPTAGLLGYAARIAVGTAVAVFGKGVLGAQNAEYVVAGAWAGVYRQLIRQFNVPLLAPALAGYPGPVQLRGYTAPAAVTPAGMRTGASPEGRVGAGSLF